MRASDKIIIMAFDKFDRIVEILVNKNAIDRQLYQAEIKTLREELDNVKKIHHHTVKSLEHQLRQATGSGE